LKRESIGVSQLFCHSSDQKPLIFTALKTCLQESCCSAKRLR
jgi:hypothetical protein